MSDSSVQSVVSAVTEAVRSGRLVPGHRLVEAEYVKRLNVSRSTVREAFQRLVADGLLHFERHRGVTVRQLSRKEVQDLYQVRASLEGLAARLAAPVLAKAPKKLESLQARMDKAVAKGDMAAFSRGNVAFHQLIHDAADNALASELNERFAHSLYWLQFRVMVDAARVFDTNAGHRKVTAALIAGDAAKADRTMQAHIRDAHALVEALPDDHFKAP